MRARFTFFELACIIAALALLLGMLLVGAGLNWPRYRQPAWPQRKEAPDAA